jgi:hypothetical protein
MKQLRLLLPNAGWDAEPRKEPVEVPDTLPRRWSDLPAVGHFCAGAMEPAEQLGDPMDSGDEGPTTLFWWQWHDKGESPLELALWLAHNLGVSYAMRGMTYPWLDAPMHLMSLTPEQRAILRVHLDLADRVQARSTEATDTQRLDWLERNLLHLTHDRASSSLDMSGVAVRGQLINEARGSGGGPGRFKVAHRNIRDAVDAAMAWTNETKQP